MPSIILCQCGNEIRSKAISPQLLRCSICHRQPALGVALVSGDIGLFAAVLIVLALFTAAPGAWMMIDILSLPAADAPQHSLPVWAYLAIFAGLVQVGYSVYLLQFPHWLSLQTVALVSLIWAALAAIVFGGTLVGSSAGWAGTALQFGDMLPAIKGPRLSRVSSWCFALMVAWTAFSIWCGWRAQMARAQLLRLQTAEPENGSP